MLVCAWLLWRLKMLLLFQLLRLGCHFILHFLLLSLHHRLAHLFQGCFGRLRLRARL